jgi:polyhydroxyalkanoate synthesis repressor PhaR
MQDETLKIKKYANRRLYDTEQSRYITLAELSTIVREGRTVEVVDAKSGDDLTRQVLVQVILEEQERLDLLPIDMLHQVIRVQGTIQAGALSSFLSESMTRFMDMGETWKGQVEGAFGDVAGVAREGAKAWMGAVEGMFKDWSVPGGPPTGANGAPTAQDEPPATEPDEAPEPEREPVNLAKDVEDLKSKMNDLLAMLAGKD